MILRIDEISIPIDYDETKLSGKIAKILRLPENKILSYKIVKKAIDARKKKQMIYFVYSLNVHIKNAKTLLSKSSIQQTIKRHRLRIITPYIYEIPTIKQNKIKRPPIVVGSGPSGMFCALLLSKAGCKPLIIERGQYIDTRIKDVEIFLSTGKINTKSNIQFGEGGAGTFSDGKLNTLITNPRIKYVFDEFIKAGAPKDIAFDARPHIGTDNIRKVTKNMREQIIDLGGKFLFDTTLTNIVVINNKIKSVILNQTDEIETDYLVLAIGHSARDTYKMLYENDLHIEQKPFSIGVRIEHKAEMINKSQYDIFYNNPKLPTARYNLVAHSDNRSVYTFCMCPGGYVVPSTTEKNMVVTNGMSEYSQNGENSNSALLVNINKDDFESNHPLAGIEFQRKWENKAYIAGGGNYYAPVQLVGDFLNDKESTETANTKPTYKPGTTPTSLDKCLPSFVIKSLKSALPILNRKIDGFACHDAVLTGIETRSSSPVRLIRDKETLESNISGIFPAGEGAGYAGGIVSSAVDGMRVGESILKNYS